LFERLIPTSVLAEKAIESFSQLSFLSFISYLGKTSSKRVKGKDKKRRFR